MRQLSIVVTCTSTKLVPVDSALRARSLPHGSTHHRLNAWHDRISRAPSPTMLRDLYGGPGWRQVQLLEATAQKRGWDTRTYVASAGLGVRELDARGPSYAATFSSGSPDTVVTGMAEQSAWWLGLADLPGSRRLAAVTGDAVLLVLSDAYARVMADDLEALAACSTPAFLVGGTGPLDGMVRVPVERQLRRALGGTTTTLGLRVANAWLEMATPSTIGSTEHLVSWRGWTARNVSDDSYDRTRLSDDAVLTVIRMLIAESPTLSRTQALRLLRDRGFACEQQRFGHLFGRAAVA